jgi:hypothetical protein
MRPPIDASADDESAYSVSRRASISRQRLRPPTLNLCYLCTQADETSDSSSSSDEDANGWRLAILSCGVVRHPPADDDREAEANQAANQPARRHARGAQASSAGRQQPRPPRPVAPAAQPPPPPPQVPVAPPAEGQVEWELPRPLPPLFRKDVLPTAKCLAGLKEFMSLHEPLPEEVRFVPAQ